MSRKANVEDTIHIQTKAGGRYATFCPANRRHGGKDVYLGIVIDEQAGIYRNRNQGYYRFTIEKGKEELSSEQVQYLELIKNGVESDVPRKLVIDFGDAWFLNNILETSGLANVFRNSVASLDADTLLALISFKLLNDSSNYYAERWWEGNYARYLYPGARLKSQRISEFLERAGDEEVKRRFFDLYIPHLKTIPNMSENILLDSTGLPNDIHFDYSALSNHNGVISRESRLIYVVERSTGMPIFFRAVAGNIVDVSTLRVTMNMLKVQGIDVRHSILDAGYSSEANLRAMLDQGISFLTRMPEHQKVKNYMAEHGKDVRIEENFLKYGNRRIFMKQDTMSVGQYTCYTYICVDFDRQHDEQDKYLDRYYEARHKKGRKSTKPMDDMGYFMLISAEKLKKEEVLPLYYMRQNIEQTFDFAKNDVDLLPLYTNKAETFRGHLLLSFMATSALLTVRSHLKSRKKLERLCPKMTLADMRYVKSVVYPKTLVTTENSKYVNLVLDELKLEIPPMVTLP
jgi:hypothetical protein